MRIGTYSTYPEATEKMTAPEINPITVAPRCYCVVFGAGACGLKLKPIIKTVAQGAGEHQLTSKSTLMIEKLFCAEPRESKIHVNHRTPSSL